MAGSLPNSTPGCRFRSDWSRDREKKEDYSGSAGSPDLLQRVAGRRDINLPLLLLWVLQRICGRDLLADYCLLQMHYRPSGRLRRPLRTPSPSSVNDHVHRGIPKIYQTHHTILLIRTSLPDLLAQNGKWAKPDSMDSL
jgi:hypothetical protein